MKRGFSLLWIVWAVVVILIVAAIFLYVARKRQTSPPPIPTPTPTETPSPTPTQISQPDDHFYAIGTLAKDKPGMKAGVWYLEYDAADGSRENVELAFTTESQCTIGSRTEACSRERLVRGSRVEIVGNKTEAAVRVRTLVQLDLDQKG